MHVLHFMQRLLSFSPTMIHEDSQPLVIWVNIYVNVIQISKLTHRQVVFVKEKSQNWDASSFFFLLLPIQLKSLQFLFSRYVKCAHRSKEVMKTRLQEQQMGWPLENFNLWLNSYSYKESKHVAWATANEFSWHDDWKEMEEWSPSPRNTLQYSLHSVGAPRISRWKCNI